MRMLLNMNEWVERTHKNAMDHGFWNDNPEISKIFALIHDELSEALEENRAGRPLVWYVCPMADRQMCNWTNTDCHYKGHERCVNLHREPKPEGTAVELVDVIFRIFDYFGHIGLHFEGDMTIGGFIENAPDDDDIAEMKISELYELVNRLHCYVAKAYMEREESERLSDLMVVVLEILLWLSYRGIDPEEVMEIKYNFNVSRPYRHNRNY